MVHFKGRLVRAYVGTAGRYTNRKVIHVELENEKLYREIDGSCRAGYRGRELVLCADHLDLAEAVAHLGDTIDGAFQGTDTLELVAPPPLEPPPVAPDQPAPPAHDGGTDGT